MWFIMDNLVEYYQAKRGIETNYRSLWYERYKKSYIKIALSFFSRLFQKKYKPIRVLFVLFLLNTLIILTYGAYQFEKKLLAENKELAYKLDVENVKIKKVISNLEYYYAGVGEGVNEIISMIKDGTDDIDENKLIKPLMDEHIKIVIELHGVKKYELRFTDMIFPVKDFENSYVGCSQAEFGWRKLRTETNQTFHKGFDIYNPYNDEIIACLEGEIIRVGENKRYGKFILQRTLIDGHFHFVYYGHLDKIDVKAKQIVKQGERIGLMGATGTKCFGKHLHWQISKYHEFIVDGKKRYRHEVINPVINTTWYGKKLESSRII